MIATVRRVTIFWIIEKYYKTFSKQYLFPSISLIVKNFKYYVSPIIHRRLDPDKAPITAINNAAPMIAQTIGIPANSISSGARN